MNELNHPVHKKLVILLVIAFVAALLFNYLFFGKQLGISVLVFSSIAIIVLAVLSKYFAVQQKALVWFGLPILFFSSMILLRDNTLLLVLNTLTILGLCIMLGRLYSDNTILKFSIMDYVFTLVGWPFKYIRSAFIGIYYMNQNSKTTSNKVGKRIIVGVVIALPVLVLFGFLFASADVAFKSFLDSVFLFTVPQTLIPQIGIIVGMFALSFGILTYIYQLPYAYVSQYSAPLPDSTAPQQEKVVVDRKIEVGVFLGLIALLFLVFIGFQINYLFGGAVTIANSAITYAEYARHGFWELLIVAITTLLILLVTETFTGKHDNRFGWFTIPSIAIVIEVLIIIASALKRMMLYQSAYGMTTLRVYVAAFIVLLAIIFLILAAKILLKKQHAFFAFGLFLSVLTFMVGMNILNPDAYIANHNVVRYKESGKIDATYLGNMSADAIPQMVSIRESLNEEDKDVIDSALANQRTRLEDSNQHWQSYNISRRDALGLLQ